MAYLTGGVSRGTTQTNPAWDGTLAPSWDETFDASVGSVWDEMTSMSMSLNREGWEQRRETVRQARETGKITDEEYRKFQTRRGYNYDQLARKRTDLGLKTDDELERERAEVLAMRRRYADNVKEQGDGSAVFLGEMTGYMTDPVNALSMFVGGPVLAARAFPAMNRVLAVGISEGIIGATSEAIIQPLVYTHKQQIGSPYDLEDSIEAIGYAALGGVFLGGAVEGIQSFVKTLRGDIEKVTASGKVELDDEERLAVDVINKFERELEDIPEFEFDPVAARGQMDEAVTQELENLTNGRLTAEARKAYEAEVKLLDASNPRLAKIQARLDIDDQAVEAQTILAKMERGEDVDLAKIEQRVFPNGAEAKLKELEVEQRINHEKEHLLNVENTRKNLNEQKRPKPRIRVESGKSIPESKISQLLDPEETESLARIRAQFDELENPIILDNDEFVSASDSIKKDMDEIEGLAKVEACLRE